MKVFNKIKNLWDKIFKSPPVPISVPVYSTPTARDILSSFVSVTPIPDEQLFKKLLIWINEERQIIADLEEQLKNKF